MPKGKSRKSKGKATPGFLRHLRLWIITAALLLVFLLVIWEVVLSGRGGTIAERVFGERDLTKRAAEVDRAVSTSLVKLGVLDVETEMEERSGGGYRWTHWDTEGRLPYDLSPIESNLAVTRAVRSAGGRIIRARESGPDWRGITTLDIRCGIDDRETHRIILKESDPRVETARPTPAARGPRIAIIIDDLGYNRSATTNGFIDSPFPLTLSVLPHCPHSGDVAEAAHRAGKEVLVHIPMQPEDWPATNAGDGVLLVEHTHAQIRELVAQAIADVPHAVGANNHMGSALTKDRARMRTVMESIRKEDLFFIDSMTTAQSVGLAEASRAGVPTTRNRMFLDSRLDEHGKLAVEPQLLELAAIARRRGDAVGIGHPRKETLAALERVLPRLREQGIEVVYVSQLVK